MYADIGPSPRMWNANSVGIAPIQARTKRRRGGRLCQAPHIRIHGPRAADLVVALEVLVAHDVVADRRRARAACAGAEIDLDAVARDHAAPASIERQVEERG